MALIERVHVGGTCVSEGRSPTKTVIASARVAHMARRAGEYGVAPAGHDASAPRDWRVDLRRVHDRKQARALEVDETRGFMKAVVDAESATVLGLEGGEIATLFQIAMMGKLPYTVLRNGVFSHPTLAEALNNLFTGMDRDDGGAG